MITHRFGGSELRIFPEVEYCETVFDLDGAKCGATRECSEMGNLDYARHLGYPDCWTALVTHELAHTIISEGMGHPYSPTLYAVARDYAPGTAPYEDRLAEEATVLAVERYANTGERLAILRHPDVEPFFADWAYTIQATAWRLLKAAA